MSSEFWDSWVGQEIRWRQRWLRTRRLHLDGEPERKGRRGGSARVVDVQSKLAEQLEFFNHGALTGPVALDLIFQVNSQNFPAVHNLAKHLLDVLGVLRSENAHPRRHHLLYEDDQQIKLLYVHLWHPSVSGIGTGDASKAGTWIDARPLRDVVTDFQYVKYLQVQTGKDRLDTDDSPFYLPEIPELERELILQPEQATSPEQARQWSNLNNWLVVHHRSQLQEALLKRTDASLASILCRAAVEISGARPRQFPYPDSPVSAMLDEILTCDRQMLLSESLTLPMPGLPRISGERQTFKAAARQQLERLRARWPIFDRLLVPLKVTFLVVVPEQQDKDLDNLALEILPLIHEILQPSLAPSMTRDTLPPSDDSPEDQTARKRVNFIHTHSVTAYEVIQLKRHENDPPQGHLRLALGSGTQTGSTWTRITKLCEEIHRENY